MTVRVCGFDRRVVPIQEWTSGPFRPPRWFTLGRRLRDKKPCKEKAREWTMPILLATPFRSRVTQGNGLDKG